MVDHLLAATDTALYRAKRSGKNRFEWAEGEFDADAPSSPLPTWSVAHSVGIKEIDDQHTHLGHLIDTLAAAMKNNVDREIVVTILAELVGYAEFHFATEERLMAEYRLPDRARHRDIHRRLLDDLQNVGADLDLGSISLIVRYLQEWLLRHVDSADKELGRALIAKGWHALTPASHAA